MRKWADFPNKGKTQIAGALMKLTINWEPVVCLSNREQLSSCTPPGREDCMGLPGRFHRSGHVFLKNYTLMKGVECGCHIINPDCSEYVCILSYTSRVQDCTTSHLFIVLSWR